MSSYKKRTKLLKDVKQEQKPDNNIALFDLLIVLEITKPYKKEPRIETSKLLFK
tara:strand:- start:350 stop:511 length:162 start_codon:yes stop_codon:yes gene_type:complete